jgi:hypothetical protein
VVLGALRAVDQDGSTFDQALGRGARAGGPVRREEGVEAQPGVLRLRV